VVDNEGGSDSESRTVIIENYQPVAGFEVYDELDEPAVIAAGDPGWSTDDELHYYDVQTGTNTVWIQSRDVVAEDADWERTAADPEPVGGENAEPAGWDDNNFSYDPEGQEWDTAPAIPDGFPNEAWGIEYFRVNWGDGDTDSFDYQDPPDAPEDGDDDNNQVAHEYNFDGGTETYTITVTVYDYLNGSDSFSRKIWLHEGAEP